MASSPLSSPPPPPLSLFRFTELAAPELPLEVVITLEGAPAVDVVEGPEVAEVLLLLVWWSSRKKLGPDPTTGVAKFRGLGKVLLSFARKFHSG